MKHFIFILIILSLSSCQFFQDKVDTSKLIPIAKIDVKKNNVKRRIYKQIDWNNVNIGTDLYQMDSLRTLAKSNATVKFHDSSKLSLKENSLVVIERPKKIIKNIDMKIFVNEGTFTRTFNAQKDENHVSQIVTDRLVTYISSKKGKVGVKYKKNKPLKIAVYSDKVKIKSIANPKPQEEIKKDDVKKKKKEAVEDLMVVAVYKGGKAEIELDSKENNSEDKKNKKEKKIITVKENEVLQITHENKKKTEKPLINTKKIDIIKNEIKQVDLKIVKPKQEKKIIKKPKKQKKIIFSKTRNSKITLKWGRVKHAQKYFFDLSSSKYFSSLLYSKIIKQNYIVIDINKYTPGTYYWRIAPVIKGNIQEYKKTKTFKIK